MQNCLKVFKFKRKKWNKFHQYSKKQLKLYNKFKIKDQFQLYISKFVSKKNLYKNNFNKLKFFSFFYGNLRQNILKKYIFKLTNNLNISSNSYLDYQHKILNFFESRLDIVLYRVCFSLSLKGSSQLILHGHVLVNGITVKKKAYFLQKNDLITIAYNKKSRDLVKENLKKSNFWPVPSKHLLINYKTLQIFFVDRNVPNFSLDNYLNIGSIIQILKK